MFDVTDELKPRTKAGCSTLLIMLVWVQLVTDLSVQGSCFVTPFKAISPLVLGNMSLCGLIYSHWL